jgi:hypothetical protein
MFSLVFRSVRLRTWYTYTGVLALVSVLMYVTGLSPYFILRAQAAQLETLSDTLSTSKPGVGANHTIRFTTPTGVVADGSTIEIAVPAGFDMSTIGEDDIDIADDGVDLTTALSCGAVQAAVSTSTQLITIQICSGGGGAIAPGSVVAIEVGTHATASGSGTQQILNHGTTGSYKLTIGGTMADEGGTELVIIDAVTITGEVATYFDFSIGGVDAGEVVNADATQTFSTTTATSVAFGTVAPNTEYVLAQDLAVTTNAVNGFTVTVEAAGDLQSSGGATINSFSDGTGVAVPGAWTQPTGTTGSPDTYGHWGLTSEDITLSNNDPFGAALYAGNFINTPREIMYATTSANGIAPHIGATRVGYKLEVSTLQEAATDYTTSLTYVATPVF